MPRPPKPPPPASKPRTFEEVRAANLQDPFHAARLARLASGERFDDPTVSAPAMREVTTGSSSGTTATAAATSPPLMGRWRNGGRGTISARLEPDNSRSDDVATDPQARVRRDDDFDVLENGVVVGRIFLVPVAPEGRPWMWASGHNGDIRRAAHGYEATREAAMEAFAKSWPEGKKSKCPRSGRLEGGWLGPPREPRIGSVGPSEALDNMIDVHHLPAEQASAVEGHAPGTAVAPLSFGKHARASFYIDGFNLYHAIDDLHDNTLKWLNLKSLCESFLHPHNCIARIAFFTALNTWDKAKRERHVDYITALEALGVEVIRGTFDRPRRYCNTHNLWCKNHSEKKTDVGIAVNLLGDGYEDKYEVAFLLSADSDHVPLAERFRASLKNKHLFVISPPNRLTQARELTKAVGRQPLKLTAGRIRQHLFQSEFRDTNGKLIVARPALYGRHGE